MSIVYTNGSCNYSSEAWSTSVYYAYEEGRLRRNCAKAQARLSLRWVSMRCVPKSHGLFRKFHIKSEIYLSRNM